MKKVFFTLILCLFTTLCCGSSIYNNLNWEGNDPLLKDSKGPTIVLQSGWACSFYTGFCKYHKIISPGESFSTQDALGKIYGLYIKRPFSSYALAPIKEGCSQLYADANTTIRVEGSYDSFHNRVYARCNVEN